MVDKELSVFTAKYPSIDELIDNSFLSEKIKRQYGMLYQTKQADGHETLIRRKIFQKMFFSIK